VLLALTLGNMNTLAALAAPRLAEIGRIKSAGLSVSAVKNVAMKIELKGAV